MTRVRRHLLEAPHTDRIPKTLRSCRPGGRRWPIEMLPVHRDAEGGYPPNSHDCNPLETAFARLQDMIGTHFLRHPAEKKVQNLHRKIVEFWPQCADLLAELISRGQPAAMQDIIIAKGGNTGR